MGKGKKEKEGYSPVKLANRRLPFHLPYMNPARNWGSSLWCSDSEMRQSHEQHTLAAAQGAGSEIAEDKDQDIVYVHVYFIPLVGGLLLHLD
jgi:hypothetical protein